MRGRELRCWPTRSERGERVPSASWMATHPLERKVSVVHAMPAQCECVSVGVSVSVRVSVSVNVAAARRLEEPRAVRL